jgi:Ca2+-binding RTX toxin-like protein
MAQEYWRTHAIEGDGFSNVIHANFAAAEALYNYKKYGYMTYYDVWDRTVRAEGGDDLIIRDRPGDYVPDGFVGRSHEQFFDHYNMQEVHLTGNVVVSGGTGDDTVSYQAYSGAMEIDLQPVAQVTDYEPHFWDGLADFAGTAKIKTLSGIEIHGFDYLHSIENARGGDNHDDIFGSDGANELSGLGGDDLIEGRGGNDTILGGAGDDTLEGGDGADTIEGGDDDDHIWGNDQDDRLVGNDGDDTIRGGDGEDTLIAGAGEDHAHGGDGDDKIYGGPGENRLYGDDGDDTIWMLGGEGWIEGGDGEDTIYGGHDTDYIDTGSWNDGADVVRAGGGADRVVVGAYDDADGGAGRDTLVVLEHGIAPTTIEVQANGSGFFFAVDGFNMGTIDDFEIFLTGDGGDEILLHGATDYSVYSQGGNDLVESGNGDDKIVTESGADTVSSGGGDDTIWAGLHDDEIDAGAGDDEVYAGAGDDTVLGGDGDDEISGWHGEDELRGGDGEDTIEGGGGDDLIVGGDDDDLLTGGSGRDGFVFKQGDGGADTITDFAVGHDWLGVSEFLRESTVDGFDYGVVAFEHGNGQDVWLLGNLVGGGWRHFVTLEDQVLADVQAAIADGALFDAPGTGLGGGGGLQTGNPPDHDPLPVGLALDPDRLFQMDGGETGYLELVF